jgi:hypothetical protein
MTLGIYADRIPNIGLDEPVVEREAGERFLAALTFSVGNELVGHRRGLVPGKHALLLEHYLVHVSLQREL